MMVFRLSSNIDQIDIEFIAEQMTTLEIINLFDYSY